MDADKEGFLRSQTSLIQTIGRAARNLDGTVLLYADRETPSIAFAISETNRRRKIQEDYNTAHGITPTSVVKNIQESLYAPEAMDYFDVKVAETKSKYDISPKALPKEIVRLENLMKKAAKDLDFEKAAELRDVIQGLRRRQLEVA